MNDLSIIIPSSRQDLIFLCLRSLAENELSGLKAEIIVIENPGTNVDKKFIPFFPTQTSLKIIKSRVNHPAKMRNLGVSEASGKYLVFLDDDIVVPKNWLKTGHQILEKNSDNIICGPNTDNSKSISGKIANVIQSLYISEGLKTHKIKEQSQEVDLHNIPLNNCVLKKEIFDKIGGFNDKIDYYLDDVEFFYIAHKLGYKFFQYPELAILHYCREFPFDFLKYKFFARKKIGYNAFFFPELYKGSFAIKIVLLTYLLIPFLIYLFFHNQQYFLFLAMAGFLLYFFVVIFFSLGIIVREKNWKYIILPLGIFLTHFVNYSGFTFGLLKGLVNFKEYKKIKEIKKIRYAIFSDKNN